MSIFRSPRPQSTDQHEGNEAADRGNQPLSTVPKSSANPVVLIATVVIAAVGAFYVLEQNSDHNIIEPPPLGGISEFISDAFPQGWAFFTKPITAENIDPYSSKNNSFEKITTAPNDALRYAVGFNRASRNQAAEFSVVLAGIPHSKWTSCGEMSSSSCLKIAALTYVSALNPMPLATVCGDVVLLASRTTPWAYRGLVASSEVPVEAIGLHVRCSEPAK